MKEYLRMRNRRTILALLGVALASVFVACHYEFAAGSLRLVRIKKTEDSHVSLFQSNVETLYTQIYERHMKVLEAGGTPKIVVYRDQDGTGFGNRMRATSYAFLLSLYSGRLFLVDHADHEIHFNNPGNDVNIFWRNFDRLTDVKSLSKQVISVPQAMYQDFCGEIPPLDESADMYEHIHGNDPSTCFLGNETQRDWAINVFGTSNDKEIRGQIMSFLLKRPQPNLLLYVSTLKQALQWDANPVHICLQYRAFVDDGFRFMKYLPNFCNQAREILVHILQKTDKGRVTSIWVTSDSEDVPQLLQKCSKLDNVNFVVSPFKVEHTSQMVDGTIKHPIVEWYLLGEVDWVLSTGTSFAEFAMARTNYTRNFYVWDESTETLSPYIPSDNHES